MKKYVEAAKKADFKAIGQRFGIDQVTARIIRNRDIITPEEVDEFLNATKEDFGDPTLMADMLIAVDIIREALEMLSDCRTDTAVFDVTALSVTLKRKGAKA